MVRDKNGILAEVNDPMTALDVNGIYPSLLFRSYGTNGLYYISYSNKYIFGKKGINPYPVIYFGTPEQANKILGTDANGDLVWLDE